MYISCIQALSFAGRYINCKFYNEIILIKNKLRYRPEWISICCIFPESRYCLYGSFHNFLNNKEYLLGRLLPKLLNPKKSALNEIVNNAISRTSKN